MFQIQITLKNKKNTFMKTTMKKIVIAAVAVGFVFGISSCEKHTCPTYSKAETKQVDSKA